MEAVDSLEMVEAERCWGRWGKDPDLAEEPRRQEVFEVVGNTAAGKGQAGEWAGDREEEQDHHT